MGRLATILLFAFGMAIARETIAMPMDVEAAKKLPRLEQLVAQAKTGKAPSTAERADLLAFLKTQDSVLTSAAAWILSCDVANSQENLKALIEIEPESYALAAAFVKMAIIRLSETDETKRMARLQELTNSDNPYVQVEAACEITAHDAKAGMEIFRRLAQDKRNPARAEIARQLKRLDPGAELKSVAPPTDDLYAIVLDLIRPPDSLSEHSLRGQRLQGEIGPPFSTRTEKLKFAWKLAPDAAVDAVEIRWIAADTRGVAPLNHIISTKKSEPGQTEGEFTLSKPTAGFPAGKYRLELWQAGKIIHSEQFEIKNG